MLNLKYLAIILLPLLFAESLSHGAHSHPIKCPQLRTKIMGEIETQTIEVLQGNQRNLYGANPIRFAYDSSAVKSITAVQKTNILDAIDTVFNFYSSFVSVVNKVTSSFSVTSCGDYPLSATQKAKQWSNTDMVFYLQTKTESSNWIAGATACVIQNIDKRPVVGLIQLNINYIEKSFNYYKFKALVDILIHEVFHALAFSPNLFPYFNNGSYILGTDFSTGSPPWVAFPNIVAWAKAHYSCTSLTKVYLEDDGGQGSSGAHWERSTLMNDLMTASNLVGDGVWSGINLALMKDSGWYTVDDNFSETIYWGKGKGCTFLSSLCTVTPLPDEFCNSSTSYLGGFYNGGFGFCSSSDQFIDYGCSYVTQYQNTVCYNPSNSQNSGVAELVRAGSDYAWNCKAVQSTLRPTNQDFSSTFNSANLAQCYPATCSNGGVTFIISSSRQLICTTNGAILTLTGYSGELTCPSSISSYCERMYNCDNMCNSGGFCMKKVCICTPGFSGISCACGNGYYQNNGNCTACSLLNCKRCDANVCTVCKVGFILNDAGTFCEISNEVFAYSKRLSSLFVLALLMLSI